MPKIARELKPIEVGRLKAPGLVSVGGVPGLSLQITPTGARSWILRAKVGDKRRDMGLGPFPGVTLAQAREKARAAREQVAQGKDPVLARQRAQSQLRAEQASIVTFESAARGYLKAKSREWKGSKSLTQWTGTLENYVFPTIGNFHVQDINDSHVLAILEPIWIVKTETAVRVRGRIESILDWAKAMKYRTGENPARWRGHLDKLLSAPKKTTAVVHHEAVPVDGAPAFYAALQMRNGFAARALEFALLTAARSGEVRGAQWSEIDIDRGLWTIPGTRMKAGKEHRVPLSKLAIQVLCAQPKIEDYRLVFPAPRGGQLSDMAMTAVMRRMELTAVPHGLRSTFRDWAGDRTNFPRDMAEMALAHKVSDETEAAYRRSDMLERRRVMMEAWADFLLTQNLEENTKR